MGNVLQRLLVPLATECTARVRHAVVVGALLLLAGLAGHAVLAVTAGPGSLLKGWVYTAVIAGAGLLCAARSVAVRRDRAIWALMTAAIVASSTGNVYYYGVLFSMDSAPYPSLADLCWVLFFPPTYLALALLVRRHLRHLPRSTWLDGAIGALALGATVAGVVLPAVLASTDGARLAAVATALIYPSGDLLLLMMVVLTVALSGWRAGGAWGLIGLGLALTAGADTIYCLRVATRTYVDGTLLDSLWPLGMLLIAFAAWQPARPIRGRLEGAGALAVPYAFTIVALVLLIIDHFHELSSLSVGLAAASVALAGYRTLRTFTELRDLGDSRRLALRDDLTGLGNRRDLQRRLDALERAAGELPAALLLIDLDRFKEVNDTLGHAAGDKLLEEVAERLRVATPREAAICRLGGDEFAVLLPPGTEVLAAQRTADAVRAAVQRSLLLRGMTLQIDASVGVAAYPADAVTASDLLQRADVAMYAAKRAGTGVERYDPALNGHSPDRLVLLGELRAAIATGQLVLHYQPQRDLRSGRVTSVEALVRWQHPRRGLLEPDDFIPQAERTDLMRPLTLAVLDQALRQAAAWHRAGLPLGVAVNVSVANLLDPAFPSAVADLLARTGIAPSGLQLEITENGVMADPERAGTVLHELREMGVGLSLDDFGTGHSSLAHLKRLPVGEVKIDRTFVMNMGSDALDAAIVRSTIDLGHSLGVSVVAEGVEDEQTLQALAQLGCDGAQGYHLSRPLPAEALESWLRGQEDAATALTAPGAR